MTKCEHFESRYSALIDGEYDAQEVPELMEHLAKCPACGDFFLEIRALDSRVSEFNEPVYEKSPASFHIWENIAAQSGLQPSILRRATKFWQIIPIAAAILLVSFLGFSMYGLFNPEDAAVENEMSITLEERSGDMTEHHFVQIVKELMQSDRKYQVAMLKVMREVIHMYPDGASMEGESLNEDMNNYEKPSSNEQNDSIGS